MMKKLLTRSLIVIAGVSTLCAVIGGDRLFVPLEKVETPEQRLEQINQTFRFKIASALHEAAKQASVQIRTDNFVAILFDDEGSPVVVNAAISGVENLTLKQLARGADVLFTFLQVPQGSALPSGFYTVRFLQRETQWKAQFKDLEGRVILEADAEVNEEDPALRWKGGIRAESDQSSRFRQKDGVTSGIIIATGDVIILEIGIHPSSWSARVQVPLVKGVTTPLNQYTVITRATQKFYQDARRVLSRVRAYVAVSSYDRLMIGTRNDVLLVHTVFQGVEKLTLDDLAKGQDVFLRYIRYSPPHPMIPTGFAVVRILRNPAGQWVAQIRELQGKPILELPATVETVGKPSSANQPLLTLGLSEDTEYSVVLPQGIRINITYKDRTHGAYEDVEKPEQKFKRVREEFRSAIVSEMQKAAAQAGVKIRTDNFVALPLDDSTVFVNAMVEGYDQLTLEDLAKGADAMFIFSSAKLSAAGREVEPGFYVVHISQNPAGQWIAQFKNQEGRVVLETEAAVEKADPASATMQPMCTVGPHGELILFDEHDSLKNIYVELAFRHSERRGVPYLLVDHGKALLEATREYLLSQDLYPEMKSKIQNGSVSVPVLGSSITLKDLNGRVAVLETQNTGSRESYRIIIAISDYRKKPDPGLRYCNCGEIGDHLCPNSWSCKDCCDLLKKVFQK